MTSMTRRVFVTTVAVAGLLAGRGIASQPSGAPDPFERVAWLIGRWEGTSE